jgi:hypothetical protein
MWVKLGSELLNLAQVVRVRFNAGWKNGQHELVAEVEGLIKGDVQTFVRYRGAEAELLQTVLESRALSPELVPVGAAANPTYASPFATAASATTNTVHDM